MKKTLLCFKKATRFRNLGINNKKPSWPFANCLDWYVQTKQILLKSTLSLLKVSKGRYLFLFITFQKIYVSSFQTEITFWWTRKFENLREHAFWCKKTQISSLKDVFEVFFRRFSLTRCKTIFLQTQYACFGFAVCLNLPFSGQYPENDWRSSSLYLNVSFCI